MIKPTERALFLSRMVKVYDWRVGAELGVYEGATTAHLLEEHPNLSMIGVDQYKPILGGPKDKATGHSPKSAEVILAARDKALAVAERFKPRFLLIESDTLSAAARWGRWPFDFIFIDASHVTADVVADFNAWRPGVLPGGYVFGHDADWPSLQAAFKILNIEPTYYPGNVWGVRV